MKYRTIWPLKWHKHINISSPLAMVVTMAARSGWMKDAYNTTNSETGVENWCGTNA